MTATSAHGRTDVSRRPSDGAVIVGVDATPAGLVTVDWAAREAITRDTELHIVNTWTWPHLAPWLTFADRAVRDDLEHAAERLLVRCRIAAQDAGAPRISSHAYEGDASDVLGELSSSAGLLVVGTRHLGPLARAVLGSTSIAAVSAASCPIAVVGENAAPPDCVVVGLAAEPSDEAALRFGFDYAQRHGLPLQALYCWDPTHLALADLRVPTSAGTWLAEAIAGWRAEYLDVPVQTTWREVHPVAGLLKAAGRTGLLVVGRHKDSGSRGVRRHPGSTVLGLLHHAECGVVVVPQ